MSSRRLQKLIHVGCRQLGIDSDTRRELQLIACGKASMTEMNENDLKQVVKALKARGFAPEVRGEKKRYPAAPRADLRLVHVLWRKLGDAGELDQPSRAGLNAFVRTQFAKKWGSVPIDIDTLRDADKINAVVRALKAWCQRAGIELRK
ncbi:gp16 family protein [Profundibacter sp.]